MKFVITTERGPGVRKTLKKVGKFDVRRCSIYMVSSTKPLEGTNKWRDDLGEGLHFPLRNYKIQRWLDNLNKQHRIRRLKMAGKNLSNDEAAIEPFQQEFQKVIREKT